MFSWYFILLISHTVCGEWYYGSKENVGRLMSQRKFAYYAKPYLELPQSEKSKNIRRKSTACNTNLKGYWIGECGGRYLDFDDAEYKECSSGTHCGCQPNAECPPALRSNPCIPIDKPYPMQEKATFTFSGTTALEWTSLVYPYEFTEDGKYKRIPPTTSKVFGMVKQDVKEGKFLQVITKQYVKDHFTVGLRSFTLIVPNDGDNTYTKYMGYLPDKKCQRTVLKKFEPFGMDIENYLLTDTTTDKDGIILQTWEYKANVEWMDVANFHWKWVVQSDVTEGTSRPVMSSYYDDEGLLDEDWQSEKVQKIDWQTQSFDADMSEELKWYADMWKEKGDLFTVPPICQ